MSASFLPPLLHEPTARERRLHVIRRTVRDPEGRLPPYRVPIDGAELRTARPERPLSIAALDLAVHPKVKERDLKERAWRRSFLELPHDIPRSKCGAPLPPFRELPTEIAERIFSVVDHADFADVCERILADGPDKNRADRMTVLAQRLAISSTAGKARKHALLRETATRLPCDEAVLALAGLHHFPPPGKAGRAAMDDVRKRLASLPKESQPIGFHLIAGQRHADPQVAAEIREHLRADARAIPDPEIAADALLSIAAHPLRGQEWKCFEDALADAETIGDPAARERMRGELMRYGRPEEAAIPT